jgi:hypothetical protein
VRAHANPEGILVALLDLNGDLDLSVPSDPHPWPDSPTTYARPSFDNLHNPARVITSRMRVLDLALGLARALVLALGIDRSPRRDLDIDLALGIDRSRDLDRALARDLDRALARTLDMALDLDLDLDLAHAQKIARVLALDIDLDIVQEVARVITRARDRALDLDRFLSTVQVDASGADLSDLELGHDPREYRHVLVGVIWNRDTRWPPGVRVSITRISEEIQPGVWRVHGGTERDPHEASRV